MWPPALSVLCTRKYKTAEEEADASNIEYE
jgi:hypothetical protein